MGTHLALHRLYVPWEKKKKDVIKIETPVQIISETRHYLFPLQDKCSEPDTFAGSPG